MRGFRNFTMAASLFVVAPVAYGADGAGQAPAQNTHQNGRQNGPLKPGGSAGVRTAQLPRTGLALVGASAIIAVVAVVASSGGGGNSGQANTQIAPTTTAP
ncbi:MAG TPA: hypothetical protein VFI23_01635 [Rhizomicrobium sp.]|nr:hypothetical protein [Rhizomicrobium sp.]